VLEKHETEEAVAQILTGTEQAGVESSDHKKERQMRLLRPHLTASPGWWIKITGSFLAEMSPRD